MVLAYNFKDLLNEFSPLTSLTLPVIKANPIKIQFYEHDGSETIYDKIPPLPFINSEVFDASISDWRRLTVEDDGCKVVYEVTFDIKGSNFQFHPGDTIGIIPRNEPSEVDLLIKHLNLSEVSDLPYRFNVDKSVKGTKIPPHLPVQSTLRHVLSECVDLRCIMKKLFIRALAEHTKDENERKVLEYLCSKEGSTTYTTHVPVFIRPPNDF